MRRPSRSPKYILTLALVSASILIAGSLLRPDKRRLEQPSLSETELTRLQRMAQRQSLDNMADFFSQSAADLERFIVRLPFADRSGVIWEPDLIATAGLLQRVPAAGTFWVGANRVNTETVVACPDLPVAAMRTLEAAGLRAPRRTPVEFARPGKWVLALWRPDDQSHAFAPANFLGTQRIQCGSSPMQEVIVTLPLGEAMAGGGLFDLDGNLLALITLCGERTAAIAAESVEAGLRYGTSFHGRMSTRYGMRVANLGQAEQTYFQRKNGVVVKETWRNHGADQAGLLPGDVIVSLDGNAVGSIEDLELLVLPPVREVFELGVRRGTEALQMRLPARLSPSPPGNARAGLKLVPPPSGYLIDMVVDGSPAAAAGIRPGDRLLLMDHTVPRSLAPVRAALDEPRDRPLHVVLERGDRRWEVLLE